MDVEVVVEIDAPPERVWAVMAEVERWPEWTASMSKVELLDGHTLEAGARARVKQPRLPSGVWLVTGIEEGKSFRWEARNPGITMAATHLIEPLDGGRRSRVTLSVESSGIVAAVLSPILGGTGRRYVQMEAAGLKRRSEAAG